MNKVKQKCKLLEQKTAFAVPPAAAAVTAFTSVASAVVSSRGKLESGTQVLVPVDISI